MKFPRVVAMLLGGVAIGAIAVGVESDAAVGVELDSCDGATDTGVLSDFLHPLPAARTRRRHKMPAIGSQPARLPKSKIMFTGTIVVSLKGI